MILPTLGGTCGRDAQGRCVEPFIPFTNSLFPLRSTYGVTNFSCPAGASDLTDTDNFNGLPVLLKGLMMSMDYVKSVSAGNPPEKACTLDFNPLQLVNNVPAAFLNRFMSLGNGVSVSAWYDNLHNTAYDMKSALGCFVSGNSEKTLYPGILEPMLSVGPDSVDIAGIPAIDAQLDGIMLNLLELSNWRTIVEEKLIELAEVRINADSLAKALVALFRQLGVTTACSGCGIVKTAGYSLVSLPEREDNIPYYMTRACTVVINGVALRADELPSAKGEHKVWLNVSFEETSLDNPKTKIYTPVRAVLAKDTGGDASIQIGGVHAVSTNKFKLYIIDQVQCNLNLTLIKTDNGFVFTNGEGGFGGVGFGECDNEQGSSSQ